MYIRRSSVLILISLILLSYMDPVIAAHPGLRIAMVQMNVADGNLVQNMKYADRSIRKAAKMNVDMICFPEAADLGWLCQSAREDALTIPGKYTDMLSGLSKKYNVWISGGCLEKDGDKTYNSCFLIDRTGKIVLKYRKINTLPDLTAHLYDRGTADGIMVVETEFGVIGMTICADNSNIEYPEMVADLGAWLLITPHGYAAEEDDLADNAITFMNRIKNIAEKTNLWVVGTNTGLSLVAGGKWKGYLHSGCSTIANPKGKAVAIGRFKENDLIIYDIPPE